MSTVQWLVLVTDLSESVVRYGVWERKPDGSVSSCRADFSKPEIAQAEADDFNRGEQEAMERGGPVPPKPRSTFFVVRETLTFEEFSP